MTEQREARRGYALLVGIVRIRILTQRLESLRLPTSFTLLVTTSIVYYLLLRYSQARALQRVFVASETQTAGPALPGQ